MSWTPCLICGQRYLGEQQNAYVSRYVGEERESYRFAGCEACLDELLAPWRDRCLVRLEDGQWLYRDPEDGRGATLAPSEPPQGPSTRQNGSRARMNRKTRSAPSSEANSTGDGVPW